MGHALEDLDLVGNLLDDSGVQIQADRALNDFGAHILGKNFDDSWIDFHSVGSYTRAVQALGLTPGRRNTNSAPPCGWLCAVSVPPWRSTMP